MNDVFEKTARFEHCFWLQILGDHSRFIYEALAPVQKEEIEKASIFITVFDTLLNLAKSIDPMQLTAKAEVEVIKLREFKLELLRKHLIGKIKIHLSPTFFNHMINELEEYQRILKHLKAGQVPPVYHELHHHLVWLLDAAGHSEAISSNLDTQLEIRLFQTFLREIEGLELSNQALGTFAALMADHMFREECYYLMKLSESANLETPNCDPTKPRIKD